MRCAFRPQQYSRDRRGVEFGSRSGSRRFRGPDGVNGDRLIHAADAAHSAHSADAAHADRRIHGRFVSSAIRGEVSLRDVIRHHSMGAEWTWDGRGAAKSPLDPSLRNA